MSPNSIEERECMSHVLYVSAVDSLMYAMVCTRPDLLQVISMIRRYIHDPGRVHQRSEVNSPYIKSTIGVGLMFEKDTTSKQECIRYVDFDYARP